MISFLPCLSPSALNARASIAPRLCVSVFTATCLDLGLFLLVRCVHAYARATLSNRARRRFSSPVSIAQLFRIRHGHSSSVCLSACTSVTCCFTVKTTEPITEQSTLCGNVGKLTIGKDLCEMTIGSTQMGAPKQEQQVKLATSPFGNHAFDETLFNIYRMIPFQMTLPNPKLP